MFGAFRFLLAATVLIGHVFVDCPFHMGEAAVTDFFIISGYVMTCLIRDNYGAFGRPTLYFYADRFLRIFPQYIFYIAITQIGLLCFPFLFFSGFFKGTPSLSIFFANSLIVPVNYFFYFPALASYLLIPAAWSLGLEEQFYWIFPALVFKPWIGRITTALSVATFLTAYGEIIPSDIWGYRLLPGVLFIFMLGKSLADFNRTKDAEAFATALILYLLCVTLLAITLLQPEPLKNLSIHELTGVVLGFPIIVILSRLSRNKWDDIIGSSSYGIFLNHILIVNLLIRFDFFVGSRIEATLASLVLSTACSFGSYYLVEKTLVQYRMKIRKSCLDRFAEQKRIFQKAV